MAYLGGAMLVALIFLTCASVIGRSMNGFFYSDFAAQFIPGFAEWALELGVGPVNGDFEMIEAGVAFAIFAFIPLCQISNGHASVDIFTNRLSEKSDRILQCLIDIVFALVLVLVAVQLYKGLNSKMDSGQTTLLIEFPVWWSYALCMTGAVVAAVVAIYIAMCRIAEVLQNRALLPIGQGADH